MLKSHACGTLTVADAGSHVTLAGWVHRRRDHGGLIFLDLRDRSGLVQVVINPESAPEAHATAERFRNEFCIQVEGEVVRRSEGTVNPNLPTGEIEVRTSAVRLLGEAKTPPFYINEDADIDEALRLKYRYLDLRRPRMTHNLVFRHQVIKLIRDLMDADGFIEVETPILLKSDPTGARDYLVPSRLHPGQFYALPQSPQQLKQILMIAGVEKYFQIARCFRDEDQRSDRQPEFTQLDVEMSFVEREDVLSQMERIVTTVVETLVPEKRFSKPFSRISYQQAMDRYGNDRPDLRFGLPIVDVADLAAGSEFGVFNTVLANGGHIRGVRVPGGAAYSRREVDALVEFARSKGAKGLVTIQRDADGFRSPSAKFLGDDRMRAICDRLDVEAGDLAGLVADTPAVTAATLSALRSEAGRRANLIDPDELAFAWVLDFPAYERDEETGGWTFVHNPFAKPRAADLPKMDTGDYGSMLSEQYDLVCNGNEVGGGSIRITDPALQAKVFALMGDTPESIESVYGGFLTAFDYGTPPHGGIAFGLDRLVAILAGEPNIREVMAFPKTQTASDLMLGAPRPVTPRQLADLHIRTVE